MLSAEADRTSGSHGAYSDCQRGSFLVTSELAGSSARVGGSASQYISHVPDLAESGLVEHRAPSGMSADVGKHGEFVCVGIDCIEG